MVRKGGKGLGLGEGNLIKSPETRKQFPSGVGKYWSPSMSWKMKINEKIKNAI